MAEASFTRQRTRHAAPPRGAWQVRATVMQRWIARAFEVVADHWVLLVGLAALLLFGLLSPWSEQLARSSAPGERPSTSLAL